MTELQKIIRTLCQLQPGFGTLLGETLGTYAERAFAWNPPDVFPYRRLLKQLIINETRRLYGSESAALLDLQLQESWMLQTGEHLCIPKGRERMNEQLIDGVPVRSLNPLLSQGVILWALNAWKRGHRFNISFAGGRVPPSHKNSGFFMEYSSQRPLVAILRKRWNHTPQSMIPAVPTEELEEITRKLPTDLTPHEQEIAELILNLFVMKSTATFSDQVALVHKVMMDQVLPHGIKQITLDYHAVIKQLIPALLRDPESLLYSIFNDRVLCQHFCEMFADIPSGWQTGQLPFQKMVQRSNGTQKLGDPLEGYEDIEDLIALYENDDISEFNVLQFFVFMTECGLLPIGGMFQCGYATMIKERAIEFLNKHCAGDPRIEQIQQMPTDIPAISPAWGFDEETGLLLSVLSFMEGEGGSLSHDEANHILNVTGENALLLAAPTLMQMMEKINAPLLEKQIAEQLGSDKLLIR